MEQEKQYMSLLQLELDRNRWRAVAHDLRKQQPGPFLLLFFSFLISGIGFWGGWAFGQVDIAMQCQTRQEFQLRHHLLLPKEYVCKEKN